MARVGLRHGVGRHAVVLGVAVLLTAGFWISRMDWDPEMRLWRAIGDTSLVLMLHALIVGPMARVLPASRGFRPWRRETGIWTAILALVHTLLVFDGWFQWDLTRMLGFDFIEQLGRIARVEPGFGLSNLVGLIGLAWLLILAATSFDTAVRKLGGSGWKWLHTGAYVAFYLVVLHTAYFLFMHYKLSFHRPVPTNPNWFAEPFVVLALSVPLLQAWAYIKLVRKQANS